MDTPAQSHSQNSISNILTSLREVLIEENALLESGQAHDHQRFVRSKNQILRDLIVCQRNLPPLIEIPAVQRTVSRCAKACGPEPLPVANSCGSDDRDYLASH